MKRTKLFAALLSLGLVGTLGIGVASATATVTPLTGEVVEYILNSGFSTEGVFTAGVLEISGDDTKIFILDRNLGATAAGTGCEDPNWGYACAGGDNTYGYHFQWGNNYGFDPNSTPATGGQITTSISYNPFYTDPVFRIGNDNWLDDNSKVDLWGGSTADNTYSVNDETWKVTNATERQGPCPEGFHVPSRGELDKIKNMMGNSASAMHSQLLVPFAGYRDYNDAGVYLLGSYAYLRSSSPYSTGDPYSRNLGLDVGGLLDMYNNYRAYAYSLRCVYNSYNNYTKQVSCVEGEIPAHSHYNIEDVTVIRNGDDGWETPRDCSFVCDEGYYGDNCHVGVLYDTGFDIDYWLNVTQDTAGEYFTGAHPITVTSGDITITLLDRNLGAATNNRSSTGSYGYYFQWGNNWGFNGFDPTVAENAIDAQVDASGYGPGNFYISGTFLLNGAWSSVVNKNLRGGSGDGVDSTYYGYPSINPKDRQGPCPEGFHVPSRGEWIVLFDMLESVYNYNWGWDTYGFIKNKLYLSNAGLFWNSIQYNGDNGYFWTSSPYDSNARYIQLEDWIGGLYVSRSTSIGTAFPVRCFYDEYDRYTAKFTVNFWAGDDISLEPVCKGRVASGETISGDLLECVNGISKEGYTLTRRQVIGDGTQWNTGDVVTKGLNLVAQWTANSKPSHGGGASLVKDNCPNGDYSDSYYDGTCGEKPQNDKDVSSGTNVETIESSEEISSSEGQVNNEFQTAYEFAYKNGITTMDTIEDADMMGNLNRISMAKMLSKYAINVLGKKPANTIVPKFSDVTEELNAEYDDGVTLAYQLGIMGINMGDKFRPFDLVTRAEFVTALSRLLYDTEDGEILYYSTHMELLNKMGIITVTDPDMKELRGYVMLMLMRSTNN